MIFFNYSKLIMVRCIWIKLIVAKQAGLSIHWFNLKYISIVILIIDGNRLNLFKSEWDSKSAFSYWYVYLKCLRPCMRVYYNFLFIRRYKNMSIPRANLRQPPPQPLPKELRPFSYLDPSNDFRDTRALNSVLAQARRGLNKESEI